MYKSHVERAHPIDSPQYDARTIRSRRDVEILVESKSTIVIIVEADVIFFVTFTKRNFPVEWNKKQT